MAIFQMHPGSVTIDQSVVQWLGRNSNCNVVAQSCADVAYPSYNYRLLCTNCKAAHEFDNLGDLSRPIEDFKKFCNSHKHELQSVDEDEEGRKFREI